ncbi:hypothetical protein C2845_PM01G44520 [Panicum miliaceum]|uniref:Uncharacterized protein n=1 Tax=Panicum miliaceum TaxID=4540 RepID=A0A3L6TMD1_PANMI|nr:hypothetical protein C2845_PM01G44520 [Panicum miliaceum]
MVRSLLSRARERGGDGLPPPPKIEQQPERGATDDQRLLRRQPSRSTIGRSTASSLTAGGGGVTTRSTGNGAAGPFNAAPFSPIHRRRRGAAGSAPLLLFALVVSGGRPRDPARPAAGQGAASSRGQRRAQRGSARGGPPERTHWRRPALRPPTVQEEAMRLGRERPTAAGRRGGVRPLGEVGHHWREREGGRERGRDRAGVG